MKNLLRLTSIFVWFICLGSLNAQTVSGTVLDDANNEPLIGAAVTLKSAPANGVVTDENGTFQLKVPSLNETLVISFTGYASQEMPLNGSAKIEVRLKSGQALEEVVVIGYGAIKRSNVTGAIVSVKTEELAKVPSTNVLESLQGKIAGMDITRSSGSAGAKVNTTIRGNRSLTASNEPLVIVDGIQYNNIQDLNPNDIASMEVLKDAASTAIYGSRGANGVILVTTKRGEQGKTSISFNSYVGTSNVEGYPSVMNAEQFKTYRREANRTTGNWTGPADDAKIFGNQLNSPGYYWPDLFFKRGMQQDYQVGISMGNAKTNAYVSLDYFTEKGIFLNDQLNRYTLRANVEHTINKYVKIGTQNQITYYNQSFRRDPTNIANQISPLEMPFDSVGNVIPWVNNNRTPNPLMDEQPDNYSNTNKTSRIFTAGFIEIKPMEGLTFRSNLGVNLTTSRDGLYAGSVTVERIGSKPLARYSNENFVGFNLENVLAYTKTVGKHNFGITAIHSMLGNEYESVTAQGTNQLLAYQGFYGLANANEEVTTGSSFRKSTLLSYTGRLQYGYDDKYLFMVTGRSDGASQLSEGNKWAFFPSVSAAWRLIQEDFLKDNKHISDLKLRLSYGVAGNSAVAPYSTQSLLTRVPYAFDERPAIGYAFSTQIGNKNLRWELSNTTNFGVDLGLFKNRITATIDVFQTNTKDLLLQRLIPLSTGVTTTIENVGKTQNNGIELNINAVVINNKDLRWNLGFNWFSVREKIVELATSSNDVANGWFIGQTTQSFYDYQKTGIWQTSERDQATIYKQAPGDIKVLDQNNDGIIDSNNDRVVLGSARPDWVGNLTSDLSYKGFDLNIQLFARWGQMIRHEFIGVYDPQANTNSLVHDYWTPENPTNDFPRPNANRSQSATLYYSSLFYKDGSFAKLRNLTLGYTLPKSVSDKLHISNFRVYVTGRNLFTYSKIADYDPERGGSYAFPMTRLWVGGVNLNF